MRNATEETSTHNEDCNQLKGEKDFDSLEQRKSFVEQFMGSAVSRRPQQALRQYNADQGKDEDPDIELKQVQRLKRTVCGENARSKADLGGMARAVFGHLRRPAA